MAGQRMRVSADFDMAAFERGLENAVQKMVVDSEEDLLKAAVRIRNAATRYTPVDTGRLKAGWQATPQRDERGFYAQVSNDAEYAAEVEVGTDRTQAQPMIRPAIAEVLGIQGVGVKVTPNWEA